MSGPPFSDITGVRQNLRALSVRGAGIALASQGVLLLLHLASLAILARLLTPDDFGIMAIALLVTGFLTLFADLGLSHAIVQRDSLEEAQVSSLFWINLALAITLGCLVAASAPVLAYVFDEKRIIPVMLVLALYFPLVGARVQHRALLVRSMQFGRIKVTEVISAALGLAAGTAAAWAGWGYWSLVLMAFVTSSLPTLVYWSLSDWRPGSPKWASGTADLLRFGVNISGFNILNYFARNADNALIGWAWGSAALGIYTRAYQLMLAPLSQLNQPLSMAALPTLSRLCQEPDLYRETYLRIVGKILLLSMPLVGFLIVTADLVVLVVFGPGWDEAARILFWLAIAALYQPLSNTTGWLWISQGRARDMLRWALIGVPITVMSFVIGLPYGPIGVAAAYAIVGAFIRLPLLCYFAGRQGPVGSLDLIRQLLAHGWLALVVVALVSIARFSLAEHSPLLQLSVLAFYSFVGFLVSAWTIPLTRSELKDLYRLVHGWWRS